MIALIIVLCALLYFTVNIPRNRFVGKDKPMQEMHKNGEIPEGNDFLPKPNHMRGFQPNIILIVFEALGISTLLIYLILSKLNELTLKETLENKTKIISYCNNNNVNYAYK